MEKIIFNTKLVFADNFKLKTNTEFQTDGTINVIPVGWSEGKSMLSTPNGKPVKIRGNAEVALSGKMVFTPYKSTGKRRYNVVFHDSILEIRETKRDFIFHFRVAKTMFEKKKTIKPLLDEFDWLKKYIKKTIKERVRHGSKQNLLQGR